MLGEERLQCLSQLTYPSSTVMTLTEQLHPHFRGLVVTYEPSFRLGVWICVSIAVVLNAECWKQKAAVGPTHPPNF